MLLQGLVHPFAIVRDRSIRITSAQALARFFERVGVHETQLRVVRGGHGSRSSSRGSSVRPDDDLASREQARPEAPQRRLGHTREQRGEPLHDRQHGRMLFPSMKCVILDFDGTFTDAGQRGAPFASAFKAGIFDLVGRDISSEWDGMRREIEVPRAASAGCSTATSSRPRSPIPILSTTIAQGVLDRVGVLKNPEHRNAVIRASITGRTARRALCLPEAREVLERVLAKELRTYCITNASTEGVVKKLEMLIPGVVGEADHHLSVRRRSSGSAPAEPGRAGRDYRTSIGSRASNVPSTCDADATSMPSRRCSRRRGPSRAVIVCDIFELDLSLPVNLRDASASGEGRRRRRLRSWQRSHACPVFGTAQGIARSPLTASLARMTINVGDRLPMPRSRSPRSSVSSVPSPGEGVRRRATRQAHRDVRPSGRLHADVLRAARARLSREPGPRSGERRRIWCLSVNDRFVMAAWGQSEGDREIRFLGDGSADFAKKLGLELDLTNAGMGMRMKRFSMLVDDGVVKQLNIERLASSRSRTPRPCSRSSDDARRPRLPRGRGRARYQLHLA